MKVTKNGVAEFRYYDGAQCFLRLGAGGGQIDWTVWGPRPDEVIARHDAAHGGWQYHHPDALGSTVAVTNAAGSVIERYLYDPFGLPDIRDANGNARTATAIGNLWLFTGQEWRGDIVLANYKARWYQSTLGRFLQNDPVRFDAGDLNLYRYCFNNPINHVDPSGEVAHVARSVWTIGTAARLGWGAYQAHRAYRATQIAMEATIAAIAVANVARQAAEAANPEAPAVGNTGEEAPVPIYIDHPEAAQHGEDAIADGVKPTGVIDRSGKEARRKENLKDVDTVEGKDRDEFPPAVIKPDGKTSVRPISPSDNRGAGGSVGQQIKTLPDGTKVVVVPRPPQPKPNPPKK
ncbi:MAG: hypothetical protein KIT44_01220 [Opitutaceae bacterium]|nr:hypothetical protein [Opitutaceae bacterium]